MNKIDQVSRDALNCFTIKTVVESFDGIITICGVTKVPFGNENRCAFRFKEVEDGVLVVKNTMTQKLYDAFVMAYGGDIDALNKDFQHTGVKIKFVSSSTQSKQSLWSIVRLGTVNFDEPATDSETGEVQENFDLF